MKRLYLTAVITVPSEEGQKRIDEAIQKENVSAYVQEVFRDEHGHTREFYEDVAGKVPKGFAEAEKEFYSNTQQSEIDEDGLMFLKPEELEYQFVDYLVPLKKIVDITDTLEFGSIIILENGTSVHVEESVEEINYIIYLMEMSTLDKISDKLKDFWRKIKYKITGKRKLTYQEIIDLPENQPEYKQ